MNRPIEKPVRLGSGHCCACSGTCNHIGPIRLCEMHERQDAGVADGGVITVPGEHWDELLDVSRPSS